MSELEKIAIIHLFTMGYRGNDLLSFKLSLNNPSKLAELQELEHWKARFEAADGASQGYFSRRWVAKNILDINEEEFNRMQTEMYYDRKHDFALEQVGEAAAAEGNAGLTGALGGGDLGDDTAGDLDLGTEDTPTPSPDTPEPAESAADAGPLLATPGAEGAATPAAADTAPAKRDDQGRPYNESTPGDKGKRYVSRKHRGGDRRTGRIQSRRAQAGISGRGNLGKLAGAEELNKVWRFSEGQEANYYDEQEKKLFQETIEVKKLIESLESNKNEV